MIPVEAVEAAARVIAAGVWRTAHSRDVVPIDLARRALEAAAPHMQNTPPRHVRGWLAKNRNTDGSVSIIGRFQDEVEAERWATKWNDGTGRMSAFVEPTP